MDGTSLYADGAPKLRLLSDRVLIEVQEQGETKTQGGIIIPATVNKEEDQVVYGVAVGISAKVVKHNADNPDERIDLGMTVGFSRYAGSNTERGHRKFKIMRITDVFAVDEEVTVKA